MLLLPRATKLTLRRLVLVNALVIPLDTAVLVNVTMGKAQILLLEQQSQFIKGYF